VGLSDLLTDKCELADALLPTDVPNLSVITAGPSPANPAELLVSRCFSELMQLVREKFDFVIVDSPPVLPVSDPATISPVVDATLLVLRLNKQVRRNASEALDILIDVGGNVMGLVINGVEKKSYNTRYYEYGDRYSDRYGYYSAGPKQAAASPSPPLIVHRKPAPESSESSKG
jgi:capsular exopolysaccharide synthesis family protein